MRLRITCESGTPSSLLQLLRVTDVVLALDGVCFIARGIKNLSVLGADLNLEE